MGHSLRIAAMAGLLGAAVCGSALAQDHKPPILPGWPQPPGSAQPSDSASDEPEGLTPEELADAYARLAGLLPGDATPLHPLDEAMTAIENAGYEVTLSIGQRYVLQPQGSTWEGVHPAFREQKSPTQRDGGQDAIQIIFFYETQQIARIIWNRQFSTQCLATTLDLLGQPAGRDCVPRTHGGDAGRFACQWKMPEIGVRVKVAGMAETGDCRIEIEEWTG